MVKALENLKGTFPERLRALREHHDWSQSDLARHIWGEVTNAQGHTAARKRDRISAYESGKAAPGDANLRAMAEALGVTPAELAPELISDNVFAAAGPSVEIRMVDGLAFLRVNAQVPYEVALEVMGLLHRHGVA